MSKKDKKEKAKNFSICGCLKKPCPFQKKQGCGGLLLWKERGCTAFFVASITQKTSSTKIRSSTVSHPFATRSAIINVKANPGDKKDLDLDLKDLDLDLEGRTWTWTWTSTLTVSNWKEERAPWHNNTSPFRRKLTRSPSMLCSVLTGWPMKRLPM